MKAWWKRNAPVFLGIAIIAPGNLVCFWPSWGWTIATLVATAIVMFTIDAIVYRDA